MLFVHRLCLSLLVVPVLASAYSPQDESRASMDRIDCLINPTVSGLVSCMPPKDESALEYQWDMGDGTVYISNEGAPQIYHTYKQPGDYAVTLTVNRAEATTTSQSVLSIPELQEEDSSSQVASGY